MIRLNVFIQVNESNRNAALETAKELVAQSLNDNGCILMMFSRVQHAKMYL